MTHYLSQMLRRDGTSGTVVDSDPARCEELSLRLQDVTILQGDPSDQSFMKGAGVDHTDAFVALTGLDEENILLSLFAKSAGSGKVITKINRIDLGSITNRLDLDSTIYPKQITADLILRYVRAMENSRGSNMETLYHLIKDQVEAAEFIVKEASEITDIPLSQLKIKDDVLIGAIIHDGEVRIPRGSDTISTGDAVIVVSKLLALHDITDILD
jgi:trk system potassium uptake protein TrkA